MVSSSHLIEAKERSRKQPGYKKSGTELDKLFDQAAYLASLLEALDVGQPAVAALMQKHETFGKEHCIRDLQRSQTYRQIVAQLQVWAGGKLLSLNKQSCRDWWMPGP
jgi:hypothetical protein